MSSAAPSHDRPLPADPAADRPEESDGVPERSVRRRRVVALLVLASAVASAAVLRVDRSVKAEGRLAPRRSAQIRPDAAGEVKSRLVHEGEEVRAGAPIALLEDEGDREAVVAAEIDLMQARQALQWASLASDRDQASSQAVAAHSLYLPPAEVVELSLWLEATLRLHGPAAAVVAGTRTRLSALHAAVRARAEQIAATGASKRKSDGSQRESVRALARALDAAGRKVSDEARAAAGGRPLGGLDRALAQQEDLIFERLCALGGVLPVAVREVRLPEPGSGEPEQDPGFLALLLAYRTALFEQRQAEAESAALERLARVAPALTEGPRGELAALRRQATDFLARCRTSGRGPPDGWKGEAARTSLGELSASFAAGAAQAAGSLGAGGGKGVEELQRKASQLSAAVSAADRALGKLLSSRSLVQQGLLAAYQHDDQLALAEQAMAALFDQTDALRLLAAELVERRAAEVDLVLARRRYGVDLARERLREALGPQQADPDVRTAGAPIAEAERRPPSPVRSRQAAVVARAERALRVATRAVESKVVRAPMDGVVISLALREREPVSRKEVVGTIEDLGALVFKALLPDKDFVLAEAGQTARLWIDLGGRRRQVVGTVAWVAPGPGQLIDKDRQPWNVLVAIAEADPLLMPPQKGRAEIVVGRPRLLSLLFDSLWPAPPIVPRYPTPEVQDPTSVRVPDAAAALPRAPPGATAARLPARGT